MNLNKFIHPQSRNDLIYGILLTLVLFYICRGMVYGQFRLLEQKNGSIPFSSFVWAGPKVIIGAPNIKNINIKGQSPHPQTISIYDSEPSNARTYRIKSGFFEIDYSRNHGASDSLTLESDYSFVPSSGIGSNDSRVLSYQIGLVSTDDRENALLDFIKSAQGVYGLERQFNRIKAEEIFTFTWDSMWYWRIATQDYAYNGNPLVQQNVNWPFLYPYLSRYFSRFFNTPVADGLLSVSALGLFLTLFGLFYLGRQLNLNLWTASIAPVWVALNPFVFFMIGGFSEPLFMALFIAALLLLLKKKWTLSAIAIALLAATRFIGAAAVVLLLSYWMIWRDRSTSAPRSLFSLAALIGISAGGILLDMVIKWHLTGDLFSAFLVRKAWLIPMNSVLHSLKSIFQVNQISHGEYLPVYLIILFLIWMIAIHLARQLKEKNYETALITSSGVFMVLITWLMNPDPYAFGRYSLPLAPSIVGLLSSPHARERNISILLILTALGAGFIGVICTRLYFGYSPY